MPKGYRQIHFNVHFIKLKWNWSVTCQAAGGGEFGLVVCVGVWSVIGVHVSKFKDTNESLAVCLSRQALGWTTPWERCPFTWRSSLTPTLESTRSRWKVKETSGNVTTDASDQHVISCDTFFIHVCISIQTPLIGHNSPLVFRSHIIS